MHAYAHLRDFFFFFYEKCCCAPPSMNMQSVIHLCMYVAYKFSFLSKNGSVETSNNIFSLSYNYHMHYNLIFKESDEEPKR